MKVFRIYWGGDDPALDSDTLESAAYFASKHDVDTDPVVLAALDALEIGERYVDYLGDVWEREE